MMAMITKLTEKTRLQSCSMFFCILAPDSCILAYA